MFEPNKLCVTGKKPKQIEVTGEKQSAKWASVRMEIGGNKRSEGRREDQKEIKQRIGKKSVCFNHKCVCIWDLGK